MMVFFIHLKLIRHQSVFEMLNLKTLWSGNLSTIPVCYSDKSGNKVKIQQGVTLQAGSC